MKKGRKRRKSGQLNPQPLPPKKNRKAKKSKKR
jgi:hypothetical protein